MSERWARSIPARTSLHVPDGAAAFPYSVVEYPTFQKKWNPRWPTQATGVIAARQITRAFFPRTEVIIKDGYVADVRGSGVYAEAWREFLNFRRSTSSPIPITIVRATGCSTKPRYSTNPKFYKRPDKIKSATTLPNRTAAGGYALRSRHPRASRRPDSPEWSKEWVEFTKKNNMPDDHWFHIHNYFSPPINSACAARKTPG